MPPSLRFIAKTCFMKGVHRRALWFGGSLVGVWGGWAYGPYSNRAKWWFSLWMIWGLGPGIRDLVTVRPQTLLRCLVKWLRKRHDASTQSTCRAERNPGPRKPQIRNVQICNLAVIGLCSNNANAKRHVSWMHWDLNASPGREGSV